jgi:hypothetical protein
MNEYGVTPATPNSNMDVMVAAREQQRIQAQVVMAKKFPRSEPLAREKINRACERVDLAEQAEYTYERGNETVKGPTIRLAEVLAQNWGNLEFGTRELERSEGSSSMESYCWDIENNVYRSSTFDVPHERHTRQGVKNLTDPRDIYEMNTNNAARRLRGCILQVIPGDVVEMAVEKCRQTLRAAIGADKDKILKRARGAVDNFAKYSVTQAMLEKKLGKTLEEWDAKDIQTLNGWGVSLRDGIAKVADIFEGGAEIQLISNAQVAEINKLLATNTQARLQAMNDAGYKQVQKITVADFPKVRAAIEAVK